MRLLVFLRSGLCHPHNDKAVVQIPITEIYLTILAFTRASAMFYFIPVFSEKSIPKVAKIGMTGLLAVALVPVIVSKTPIPSTMIGLVFALAGEIMIGALMGFSVKLLYHAVAIGSALMARQAALMRAQAFDPISEDPGSVISPLFTYLSVMIFCAIGVHLEVFAAFVRSYDLIPAGLGIFKMGSLEYIVKTSSGLFVLALGMAAPLLAFSFIVNILVGILGRVASKFNILVLSFAFRILGGLTVLYFSVRLIMSYIMKGMEDTGMRMLEFIVR